MPVGGRRLATRRWRTGSRRETGFFLNVNESEFLLSPEGGGYYRVELNGPRWGTLDYDAATDTISLNLAGTKTYQLKRQAPGTAKRTMVGNWENSNMPGQIIQIEQGEAGFLIEMLSERFYPQPSEVSKTEWVILDPDGEAIG